MPRGYQRSTTAIYLMNYHIVWCPKYRRPVLINKIKDRCIQLIEEKTKELGCKILELKIMPDHVHLFIQALPVLAPNNIVAAIKGCTSRMLRKEFPHLLKMPTLWTRSYFISTAGNVPSHMIRRYIEEQKGK